MAMADRVDQLEQVILNDRDLAHNPQVINLIRVTRNATINHYHTHNYYDQPTSIVPATHTIYDPVRRIRTDNNGAIVPPSGINIPPSRIAPRNTFTPTFNPNQNYQPSIEFKPIINVNVDGRSTSNSSSSQENMGGNNLFLWFGLSFLLILFAAFLDASTGD